MSALTQLVASIPPPPFRNLELGPVVVHGYGLCVGVAIVVGIAICEWGLRRQHVDDSRFTGLAVVGVVFGFVGGRLYHVASEPRKFIDDPGEIIAVWHGGLGVYGAIFGGALAALIAAPRFSLPRRVVADAAAPAILFSQAIGRMGNYLNQELFGRPFDEPWALRVDRARRPEAFADSTTFHPTFLYEAIGNLLLGLVLLVLLVRWRSRPRGVLLALWVAGYSAIRLVVEPLRIDDAHEWMGLRQNTWVAAVLLALGLLVAFAMWRRDRRTATA